MTGELRNCEPVTTCNPLEEYYNWQRIMVASMPCTSTSYVKCSHKSRDRLGSLAPVYETV